MQVLCGKKGLSSLRRALWCNAATCCATTIEASSCRDLIQRCGVRRVTLFLLLTGSSSAYSGLSLPLELTTLPSLSLYSRVTLPSERAAARMLLRKGVCDCSSGCCFELNCVGTDILTRQELQMIDAMMLSQDR